ncbi:hypothetical protein [Reyranella sp. CPCC 100927]|uniref:hypothetical protein n=1 Tax=Reyranella sp. CPCC 100927 TaxID=2599616 RepID=UPI0011B5A39B|nr:hypothetical protein [Reyranella sp. CPCC 100927]TWT10181.1 hypothetical protein FQU96_19020 [Reyranella sp. CPCC 100927]
MFDKRLWTMGAVATLSVLLASCATVAGGTSQDIVVETDPPGAACTVARGTEGAIGSVASTPGKLTVKRRKEALQVTCTRAGYDQTAEIVDSKLRGATIGNIILLGGLLGVAVDAASGANNDYPDSVLVIMTPASFPTAAFRDEHFTKLANRIRETSAKEIKTIQDRCSSSQREMCQLDIQRIEETRDKAIAGVEQKRSAAKVAEAVPSR